MANTLRHGFEATNESNRLFLDVPLTVTDRILVEYPELATRISLLSDSSKRFVDISPADDHTRFYINAKKIGNQKTEQRKREAAKAVLSTLDSVYGWSDPDEVDPKLKRVEFHMDPIPSDGRIGMFVDLSLPASVDDETLGHIANYYMGETAQKLRYPQGQPKSLVFADIDRTSGISLSSTGLGNGGLCTEESRFRPSADHFELDAHNMYNSLEQLICFAGVVALANADTLATN